MRGVIAILSLSLAFTAAAGSRLRLDEGARPRQTRLSSSDKHTCAVLDDGTVRCWGNNADGELGDGTTSTPKTSAVQVSGLVNIISVAAGYNHTCALHAFGAVLCWGNNSFGQLGDGTNSPRLTTVQVHGLDNVTAIAAGQDFTCALRVNGTVWCWGTGSSGQLGNGASGAGTAALTPVQVQITQPVVAITAGQFHACAVVLDPVSGATARCWGFNSSGQLGDGSPTLRPVPVTVGGLSSVIDIAAGRRHTCALLTQGLVRCWGLNANGQLGNGGTDLRSTPVPAVRDAALDPIVQAVAISAGGNHSCAVYYDGTVQCWGDDTFGQLGDTKTNNFRPIADTAVFGLNDAFEVVTGTNHTCAVELINFTGRCWGDNSSGQLGNGTTNPASVPNTVNGVPGSTGIGGRNIRSADRWTCARRGNGTIVCWGGAGSTPAGPNPITITGLPDGITLSMNLTQTCTVASGDIRCFDDSGRQPFLEGGPSFLSTSIGAAHSCALPEFSFPDCFGSNARGQTGIAGLGIVDAQNQQIGNVVMVVSGAFHSCALTVDGTVYCWGDNTAGQLGGGTVGGFNDHAVRVPGLSNIIAISAGIDPGANGLGSGSFTCALSATGGVSCWGAGAKGQLGNGSTTATQPVAQAVFGLTNAVAIAAGGSHACAVLADSSAVCWGNDSTDQLGAVDTANHSTPLSVIQSFTTVRGVTIPNKLAFVTAIAPGISHTCSLQAFGAVQCWGDNSAGEIGNGTTSSQPQPRPTVVNSFTANVVPAVSLKSNGRIAIVTALMNCPAGEAHISLTLEQGQVSGSGSAVTACQGGLVQVPITVSAQGPAGFQVGAATAIVEAVVKDQGDIMEDQHWTRAVTLSVQP